MGDKYIQDNPIISWVDEVNYKRPEINLEYLKEEKTPPILTKAIRQLARHLIEGEELKENSHGASIKKDLLGKNSTCSDLTDEIRAFILADKRVCLGDVCEKYYKAPYGLTKSIILILLIFIISENKNKIIIYERKMFNFNLNSLMFERIMYQPSNFEIQKTEFDKKK